MKILLSTRMQSYVRNFVLKKTKLDLSFLTINYLNLDHDNAIAVTSFEPIIEGLNLSNTNFKFRFFSGPINLSQMVRNITFKFHATSLKQLRFLSFQNWLYLVVIFLPTFFLIFQLNDILFINRSSKFAILKSKY